METGQSLLPVPVPVPPVCSGSPSLELVGCDDASHTGMITMARRQGNETMHRYPFAKPLSAPQAASQSGAARSSRGRHDSDGAGDNRLRGKTCHLCDDGDCGPGYDLWHVLPVFESSATSEHHELEIVAVRKSCVDFVPQLCDSIQNAVRLNGASMSNTEHAGVSHKDIADAVARVRETAPGYDWDCIPGRWLVYTLLLALPFSARVVRPNAVNPVWLW
jgi:hypothetical protein